MTVYHTWASHGVVGVDKDSGIMGVGKYSSMVLEWVSFYFMAWHVEFQVKIAYSCWNGDLNVVC